MNQQTIKSAVHLSGIGLHTGQYVNLTLKPAPINHGYVFIRTDLNNAGIDADVSNVSFTTRGTVISKNKASVSTVEHLLAALRGCKIDNAIVELDANEPPILDGSATGFVDLIKSCGREEQDANVNFFELREPVRVEGQDGWRCLCCPAVA